MSLKLDPEIASLSCVMVSLAMRITLFSIILVGLGILIVGVTLN